MNGSSASSEAAAEEVHSLKKLCSLMLAVVLAATCFFCFAGTAYAAGMDAIVKVSKKSLPGPGTVGLQITITNTGSPVQDVTITYPDSSQKISLGNMATGASETHENSRWEITQAMLGKPLTFEVTWMTENGQMMSGTTPPITIEEAAETVDIKATATVSSTHVEEGEKATFTFTFENRGDVEVTNAYLIAEPLNDGNRLGDDFSVGPGETNTKTWTPTINEELTVRPVYTYTVAGEEHTLSCDPITVRVGEDDGTGTAELTISATANSTTVAPGDEVEFSIAVANQGTAEVSNVRVTCSNGQSAQLPQQSLSGGASVSGTQTVKVDATQDFTFTVTGTSDGAAVRAESEPVAIKVDESLATPTPAPSLNAADIIEIDVSVVTQVSKAGPIPVEVTVRNLSAEQLTNILVSADVIRTPAAASLEPAASAAGTTTLTLGTLASLAAGGSEIINGSIDVQETGTYVFRVSAEMPDGTLVTSETGAAQIVLEERAGLPNWMWIAIIIAAAIIIALIILLVSRRKSAQAKTAAAAPVTSGVPSTRAASSPAGSAVPKGKTQRTPSGGIPSPAAAPRARDMRSAEAGEAAGRSKAVKPAQVSKKTSARTKTAAAPHYGDRNKF